MAENLNYETPSSKCFTNGTDEPDCDTYGRYYSGDYLYNLCPAHWHIPTEAEVDALISAADEAAGETDNGGKVLKSTEGWSQNPGTNELGFNALPAGLYSMASQKVSYSNEVTHFRFGASNNFNLGSNNNKIQKSSGGLPGYLLSIRCVKNKN